MVAAYAMVISIDEMSIEIRSSWYDIGVYMKRLSKVSRFCMAATIVGVEYGSMIRLMNETDLDNMGMERSFYDHNKGRSILNEKVDDSVACL